MASTNKTSNLLLNQWIDTDPVLRSDFNQDNGKIDAAVTRRALLRLAGGTLSSTAESISIDLGNWDMEEFSTLELMFYPLTSAESGGEGPTVSLAAGAASLALASIPAGGSRGLCIRLHLLPGGVSGSFTVPGGGSGDSFTLTGVRRAQLTSLRLLCGGGEAFQSGTEYTLYGLMK